MVPKILGLLVLWIWFLPPLLADRIYISVGQARIKKSVVAFPDTKIQDNQEKLVSFVRALKDTITNDLQYTNLFTFQSPAAFIEKPDAGLTLDLFRMTDWTTIGTEFLIKTGVSVSGDNVAYEMRLFDVLGTKQILGKRYIAKLNEPHVLAHTVANEIVVALTGKPSVFFTKITMVCDKTSFKEIWLMDFDGANPKQLTHHRTLAFAPAWKPDNKKLLFSLYTKNSKNIKNIDLYEYEFSSQRSKLLSNRKGINSGASYSPDGNRITLTMSFLGNPEIFLLNPNNLEVTRLTKTLGFDVDPAWAPDAKKLAFVSTRSNQPMVYTMDADGSNVTRITFAGHYNATPSFSPDGKKIVFASDAGSRFDLFLINTDGTGLERLTKYEGSNEDPHFSPDGNFIVFSSNRTGQKNIYIISVDGTYTRRMTYGLGNCVAPKWSYF